MKERVCNIDGCLQPAAWRGREGSSQEGGGRASRVAGERVSGRAADAVKELSERFEKAKRELQADAEAAKARCEERETALAKHYESRLTSAADDIEAAKEEFAKRLKDFEGKLKHGSGASKAEL